MRPPRAFAHHCILCNVKCGTTVDLEAHLKGENHSERIRTRTSIEITSIRCTACKQHVFGDQQGWQDHCQKKQHKNAASKITGYVTPSYDASPKTRVSTVTLQCNPCNISVAEQRWKSHAQTQRHFENVSRVFQVTPPVQPPQPPPVAPPAAPTLSTDTLQPFRSTPPGQFMRCDICDVEMRSPGWTRHMQGLRHKRNVTEQARNGTQPTPPPKPPRATPSPTPEAEVRTLDQRPDPVPRGFWRGGRRSKTEVVIPGVPPKETLSPRTMPLEEYPIPENFETEVASPVPSNLTSATYVETWRKLILLEEIQMRENLSDYDMRNVPLEKHGPYFHVAIPGLEEGHPPVVVGSSVGVRMGGASFNDPWFEGYVHYIHQQEVGLKFSQEFKPQPGRLYNIRYEPSRIGIRLMYKALFTTLEEGYNGRVLFPQPDDFVGLRSMTELENCINVMKPDIVNKSLLENSRQLLAVAAIRERQPGRPPLIIWGPPGTGKTATIIEGIRQLLLINPDVRILACAPSCSAADVIAKNLLDLGVDQLFRLNAPSRPVQSLPNVLAPYTFTQKLSSNYPPDAELPEVIQTPYEVFSFPPKAQLMTYKVIVSTCMESGALGGLQLHRSHFSHIFVDDAAQALEPEAMIPIKTSADSATSIILCGDHKQLRPTVHSPLAKKLGYEKSYLERLVASSGYTIITAQTGLSMIRLNQAYRSHPAIMEFSSHHVYDGGIRACGLPNIINVLQDWPDLPKMGFPIIFHAVKGTNHQDERSPPSWDNPEECQVVKHYVDLLLTSAKLSISEIGIISPYAAQRRAIRELLHSSNLPQENCKIGSVEAFQGDERKVVIISTVRNDVTMANFDRQHNLGFMEQESRLNVALTRAMALLIVIGDPSVLVMDPSFRIFLDLIHSKGGWRGEEVEWNSRLVDEGGH